MSRIEKIIIFVLVLSALAGVSISYYNKRALRAIEVVPADIRGETERAQNAIEAGKIVDINTADKYTLTKLPQIGPHLAQDIIDYRRQYGRFNSPDELMKVKGIGPAKYEKIKGLVRTE